ncbi:MAG: hypothetical protein A2061_08410 [Gallionellales bacterium GWA2_59_43]|nr:MAG: hypothetical protein A2061_08410 [Gallionellales bacterium GWA2_59_43]
MLGAVATQNGFTELPQVVEVHDALASPKAFRLFTDGLPVWHSEHEKFTARYGRLCCGAAACVGLAAQ